MVSTDFIDEKLKNPEYGFNCLHYSVSEGAGYLDVIIQNK